MSQLSEKAPNTIRIDSLITYPVKSLQGVPRTEAKLTENGLEGDRVFTLARKAMRGDIAARLTLREHPELTQITTTCEENGVLLTAPSGDSLFLPYGINEGESVNVRSWGGSVSGLRVSSEADAWLSDFVEEDSQILAVPDSHRRTIAKEEQQTQATTFTGRATDGYPLHIASMASLQRLNEIRAQKDLPPVGIDHFRANIIITGDDLEPFAEDTWAGMETIGRDRAIKIMSIRACERCVVVEITPATGEKRQDVLKTLTSLQAERSAETKSVFGVWAAPSLISVGEVLHPGQQVRPF